MNIDGVPDTIKREDLVQLIRALGLDPNKLVRLEADRGTVTATVWAESPPGDRFAKGDDIAQHELTIRIVD